jgi:Protein of unknown function (DUF3071)
MQDLKLVGVHDDGEHLVLSAPDGQKYLLVVDDPLRAAVRLDRARLGQLQIQTEGKLRPRDIQARIRAGQTAEEVAAASGLPVEHVRRFEGPVLAEREFVVRQAQAVRVRRVGRGASAALGEVVGERLTARAVDDDAQSWDAWRGDDGVWIVALTFSAGARDRQACWSYDAQLRHVTPRDDEARWLTEDDVEEPGQRTRRLTPVGGRREAEPAPEGPPRDRVYDVEADGGVRPADGPRPAVASATVDLLDSLRERRGRRQRTSPPGDPELAGGTLTADPMDAALHGGAPSRQPGRPDPFDDLPAAHPPASRPDLAGDTDVLALAEVGDGLPGDLYDEGFGDPYGELPVEASGPVEPAPAAVTAPGTSAPAATSPAAGTSAAAGPAGQSPAAAAGDGTSERAASRRARRASVPKWDDIVFGSRRE